jgi:hypothetical protein
VLDACPHSVFIWGGRLFVANLAYILTFVVSSNMLSMNYTTAEMKSTERTKESYRHSSAEPLGSARKSEVPTTGDFHWVAAKEMGSSSFAQQTGAKNAVESSLPAEGKQDYFTRGCQEDRLIHIVK